MSRLLVYLYFSTFFYKNLVSAIVASHMTALEKQIVDLRPYQITAFIKDTAIVKTNDFFKSIICKVPAVTVDLPKNLNQSLVVSSIDLPRKSNLLVILQDKIDFDGIQSNLENYIQVSPIKIRPKCLVIFNDTLTSHDLKTIRSVLLYGWSRKFLDFTIVNLNVGEIFYFNPFLNIISNDNILTANIFPNKLKNMNKYTLRTVFIHHRPYSFDEEVDNITNYHGVDVELLYVSASVLNFRSNFVYYANFTSPLEPLQNYENDLFPGHSSLLLELYSSLEIGKAVTFHEICAVTAYSSTFKMEVSIAKLLLLTSNIILGFLIAILIHCILAITKSDSDIFEYIRLLLGQSTTKVPKTFFGKMALLLLGLFSMTFFPDIVSNLTQVFVNHEEKEIFTFKDILDSDLQPYINFLDNLGISKYDDESYEDVKSIIIVSPDEDACLNMAMKQEKVICIVSGSNAEMYMRKYKSSSGRPLIKKASIEFSKAPETLAFPPASPYVEAFDNITQTMLEAGIMKRIKSKYFDVPPAEENYADKIIEDRDDEMVFTASLTISLFGFTISILIFIIEVLFKGVKK